MALHIHKYGGTSVGSLDRIRAVAQIVAKRREAGDDVVVVVSAMAGDTNRLESLGQGLSDKPNDREMDVLLSTGEQISAALTAMALDQLGYKARSYLGWQVPMITDANHTKARCESIETKRLKDDLAASVIPVVAGFQGIDVRGDVTTIGRGGSDTSAVAIASALNADECRIYTDVDGVYTADPKIVDDAKKMELVSFEEMLELDMVEKMPPVKSIPATAEWGNEHYSLNDRARAYLDVNCAHCHNSKGAANTSGLFLEYNEMGVKKLGVLKPPVAAGRGSGNLDFNIVPGKPDESIFIYRIESTDPGILMPESGRKMVHKEGVALIREWIESLKVN